MAFNPKMTEAILALIEMLRKSGPSKPDLELESAARRTDDLLRDLDRDKIVSDSAFEDAIPEGKYIEGQLDELATNPQVQGNARAVLRNEWRQKKLAAEKDAAAAINPLETTMEGEYGKPVQKFIDDPTLPGEKRTPKVSPPITESMEDTVYRIIQDADNARAEQLASGKVLRTVPMADRPEAITATDRKLLDRTRFQRFPEGQSGGVKGTTEVVEPERLSQAQLERLNESGIGADLEDFEGGFVSRENPGFGTVSEQKKAFGSDVELTDDIIRAIEGSSGEIISDARGADRLTEVSVETSRQVATRAAARTKLLQDIDDELQKGFAVFEPIEKKLPIAYRQSGGGVERGMFDVENQQLPKRLRDLKQPLAILRERWKIIKESLSDVPDMFQSSHKELIEELKVLLADVKEYNRSIGGALKLEGTTPPTYGAGRVSTQIDEVIDPSPKHLISETKKQEAARQSQEIIDEMISPEGTGREFDRTLYSRFGTGEGNPALHAQKMKEVQAHIAFLNAREAARDLTKQDPATQQSSRAGQRIRDALIDRFQGESGRVSGGGAPSQPRNDIPPELLRPILAEIDKPSGVANSQITEQQLQQAFPHGFEHPDLEAILRAEMTEPLPEGMSATEFLRRQLDQMELDDIAEEQLSTQSSRAKLAQKMQEIKDTHFAAKRRANIKKVK